MASTIKQNGEQSMAAEDPTPDETPETQAELSKSGGGGRGDSATVSAGRPGRPSGGSVEPAGFFHVYKSGQGYWTRIGTVGGAALIILLSGNFFYTYLPIWSDYMADHTKTMLCVVLGFVALLSLLAFLVMNKAGNVDFLIATDSEMKKVNWTSREELIGSTKIVIIFVFLITMVLFVTDILFGYVFYWLHVLNQPPF